MLASVHVTNRFPFKKEEKRYHVCFFSFKCSLFGNLQPYWKNVFRKLLKNRKHPEHNVPVSVFCDIYFLEQILIVPLIHNLSY